jgi:hypothetical protein
MRLRNSMRVNIFAFGPVELPDAGIGGWRVKYCVAQMKTCFRRP